MSKKKYLLILLLVLSFLSGFAQTKPYFQQKVNYTIHVSLNDTLHELIGNISMVYVNNSPDTLHELYIHLWPNAYRNNKTALVKQQIENRKTGLYFAKSAERGGIDSLNFLINKTHVNFQYYKKQIDIAEITLPRALSPGDTVVIETPFKVKIPGDFSRMGHQGQVYQIAQWYPKPAVYDRDGWHPISYLDKGEFYSEFGSYDVYITLPDNYIVASTGVLQSNPEEETRINRRIEMTKSGNFYKTDQIPASSTDLKTLHFYQDSIHDFAWFADKRYLILKKTIVLERSHKSVDLYTYFIPADASNWENATQSISKTIQFYSKRLGDYPYARCSVVEGSLKAGSGMEYPMITLINNLGNQKLLERVIVHEVGHNWFYGMLGFNERRYPWLDEGLNSFYENEYMCYYYFGDNALADYGLSKVFNAKHFPAFYDKYLSYLFVRANHDVQAVGDSSETFSITNYGTFVYYTPVIMFRHLRSYLGENTFDKMMYDFAETWRYKHPNPYDLRTFFEQKTGKDLGWFFDKLINTTTPIDMKLNTIKNLHTKDNQWVVKTTDKTKLGAPYLISAIDSSGKTLYSTWRNSFQKHNSDTISIPENTYKISINEGFDVLEVDKRNNSMRLKGWFPKINLPKMAFLWTLSDPAKNSILYTPVIGWNMYNRWMPGIAVYSDPVVPRNLDYLIMPMYSFYANNIDGLAYNIKGPANIITKLAININGLADVGYSFNTNPNYIHHIRIGLLTRHYGYNYLSNQTDYLKIEPSLLIAFSAPQNKTITNELLIRKVFISQEIEYELIDHHVGLYHNVSEEINYQILNIHHQYSNNRKINPWKTDIDAQIYGETVKLSFELNTQYTFADKKGVDFRLFAGKMFNPTSNFLPNMNFKASGFISSTTGSNDYLFDQSMLGRSETEGLFSHQFIGNDGGFKTPTILGMTNNWLLSSNLSIDVPGKLPLKLFASIATFAKADQQLEKGEQFIYEAGIQVTIIKNIAEVYFPIFVSADMKRVEDLNKRNFSDRIRFKLNLNELNPFKFIKKYKQISL
jgi:hypothetical protein